MCAASLECHARRFASQKVAWGLGRARFRAVARMPAGPHLPPMGGSGRLLSINWWVSRRREPGDTSRRFCLIRGSRVTKLLPKGLYLVGTTTSLPGVAAAARARRGGRRPGRAGGHDVVVAHGRPARRRAGRLGALQPGGGRGAKGACGRRGRRRCAPASQPASQPAPPCAAGRRWGDTPRRSARRCRAARPQARARDTLMLHARARVRARCRTAPRAAHHAPPPLPSPAPNIGIT